VAGDRVLQAVSSLLISKVRSSDVVARWGGDELVAVLWHANEKSASTKATALEDAVASLRVPLSDHTLSVTASAGVTMIRPEDTPIKAMGRADLHMRLRKKARKLDGRAQVNAQGAPQLQVAWRPIATTTRVRRHCEEQSDEAIQDPRIKALAASPAAFYEHACPNTK
jgi:predicted signal transduction protein with EAL and GGDEF domain